MTGAYHHGDLRNALLAAAVEVLAERGVAGLSLREAARRVGVSHAAPYRHFADKQALLRAIADQGFERLVAAAEAGLAAAAAPADALRAYGRAYVRFARENPVHFRVMFTEPVPASPPGSEAGARAFALLQEAAARVAPGDADAVAMASWSVAHGLSLLFLDGRVPPEIATDPAAAQALVDAVLARIDLRG